MKIYAILLIICAVTLSCKNEKRQNQIINSHGKSIPSKPINNNNNIMDSTKNKKQFSEIFPEGTHIKFTPKDLEHLNDPILLQFKKELKIYEDNNPKIEGITSSDLSILVNDETFEEAKSYVDNSWLEYFLDKYDLQYTYNDLMKIAIEREDYKAVTLLIKKGYIFRKEEVEIAVEYKESAVAKVKLNKENKGMDNDYNPVFYIDKNSKFNEILALIIKKYNSNVIQDMDGYTNLREGSSTKTAIIEKIKSGEHVDVLDNPERVFETVEDQEGFNWYLVQTKDGKKGYVHKSRIVSK